ncbi:RNA polymerase sigma factor [Mesobacillus maritimus]|uniref:RNA polymerase sigma factor n=1 Tax=Mesobacillus maritimus TaxID=1643336 RepID=A0ABS7K805_9BACI|nr:sigma-70 family RNA polymerase sigma factor [Mesobacillus maritimus]MBY0098333.1 sigma-70 family RNA polymerase sigma factor [Mesobacillus maritimus]
MDVVEGLKKKEETALVELMNLYGDYLLRTAILLVKDKQSAEEVVQDTFITAFDKIHQLADSGKLKSWLTSILVNNCRSQQRKRSWKDIFLPFNLIERYQMDEGTLGPEDQLLHLMENQQLAVAIHALDYKYREAIILYYFNEMKINEIAQFLEVNENTIKSRLTRGRSQLKEILRRGEGGNESGKGKIETKAR